MKSIQFQLTKREFFRKEICAALREKSDVQLGEKIKITGLDGDISTVQCKAVQKILIKNRSFALKDGMPCGFGMVDHIAKNCGFRKKKRKDFVGDIIMWKPFKELWK